MLISFMAMRRLFAGIIAQDFCFPIFIDFFYFFENAIDEDANLSSKKTAREAKTENETIEYNVSFMRSSLSSGAKRKNIKEFGSRGSWLRERVNNCDSDL
jgi:hypothetical protein